MNINVQDHYFNTVCIHEYFCGTDSISLLYSVATTTTVFRNPGTDHLAFYLFSFLTGGKTAKPFAGVRVVYYEYISM